MSTSSDQRFSSRLGLILSVLGIAVGTGNIWRFPRIAAQNGGDEGAGAFLVAWLVFLLMWSVPLIIAEYAMGRKGRMGLVGTFAQVAGRRYAWMGAFVAVVASAIMFYYSVVAGWCFFYFITMFTDPLPLSTEVAMGVWNDFQDSGFPVAFHALAIGLGGLAVWKGVSSIERVNKVLIPTLLVIVLIAVGRAVTLPGAGAGLTYLFTPEWSQLTRPQIWLEALTQNAWDTGAGWGLILTYAAYMRASDSPVSNAFITGLGNNLVSMLAAITIFGTVFAALGAEMSRPEVLEIMRNSGPASTGLTFIWMPQLFARIPFGEVLAVLFFLGLSFAAVSSLISMIELATRLFVDAGMRRATAVASVVGLAFVLGIPSAINLNVFSNQDFVWGVGLMLSGAFVAFAVIRYGVGRFRREEVDNAGRGLQAGRAWDVLIGVLIPAQAVILLVWWLYLSATAYAPDTWFNPLDPFSVMTCLVQWGAAIALCLLFNRWMTDRTLGAKAGSP
ncbi:MAG: sodium-dependent transporter [Bacteroidota bacterium]